MPQAASEGPERMRRPMTAEELLSAPETGLRQEISLGCLISEPPAGFGHGEVGAKILVLLANHAKEHALGKVVAADTGFLLARGPDTLRAPDVAFVSAARCTTLGPVRGFFPGAPDLAVEILSPSERAGTIHGKVADYLAAGTRLVWVVDPDARTVTVHRSLLAARVLEGDQVLDGEDVLPDLAIRICDIFEA